jgi:hypothetical protein
MPPVSQEQRKLFRWAAANPKAAAKRGIKASVAKEFNDADPGGKLPAEVKDGKPRRGLNYNHPTSRPK